MPVVVIIPFREAMVAEMSGGQAGELFFRPLGVLVLS